MFIPFKHTHTHAPRWQQNVLGSFLKPRGRTRDISWHWHPPEDHPAFTNGEQKRCATGACFLSCFILPLQSPTAGCGDFKYFLLWNLQSGACRRVSSVPRWGTLNSEERVDGVFLERGWGYDAWSPQKHFLSKDFTACGMFMGVCGVFYSTVMSDQYRGAPEHIAVTVTLNWSVFLSKGATEVKV